MSITAPPQAPITVPMDGTVSPNNLDYRVTSSDDEPYHHGFWDCEAVLEFPDASFTMLQPSIVIGRDNTVYDFLKKKHDLYLDGRPVNKQNREEREPSEESEESFSEHGGALSASLTGGILGSDIRETGTTLAGEEQRLPIHPPGINQESQFSRIKGISKDHLRIFKSDDGNLKMSVLGRNGVFLNDIHIPQGKTRNIKHNDLVSIAGLEFILRTHSTMSSDEESASESSSEGEAPSYEAEEEEDDHDTSQSEQSEILVKAIKRSASNDVDMSEASPAATAKPATKIKLKMAAAQKPVQDDAKGKKPAVKSIDLDKLRLPNEQEIVKRKGPGRPPANGVMSKREMRERKKMLANLQRNGEDDPAVRLSLANGEAASATPVDDEAAALKKAKKRKRSEGSDDEGADGKKSADREKKKKDEEPKEPPPQRSDFTAEQLEPPQMTYAQQIWQILSDHQPKSLGLQELYEEIKRRWPFYYFKDTSGWESSVRHTIKSKHFKATSREGKGYAYTINPDEPPPAKQKPAAVSVPSSSASHDMPQHRFPPHPNYQQHPNGHGLQGATNYYRPPVNGNQSTVGAGSYPQSYAQQYARNVGLTRPPYSTNFSVPSASGQQGTPGTQAGQARPPTTNPAVSSASTIPPRPANTQPPTTLGKPPQTGAGPLSAFSQQAATRIPPRPAQQQPTTSQTAQQTQPRPNGPAPGQATAASSQPNVQPQSQQAPRPQSTTTPQPPSQTSTPQPQVAQQRPAAAPISRPGSTRPDTPQKVSPVQQIAQGIEPDVIKAFRKSIYLSLEGYKSESKKEEQRKHLEDSIAWVMKNYPSEPPEGSKLKGMVRICHDMVKEKEAQMSSG